LYASVKYFSHRIASYYLSMPLADTEDCLDLADRDFHEAVRLSPNAPQTRMQSLGLCARADIARRALPKAINDCSAMIKISPDRWVFALRAGVYQAQGNLDGAIADLTETIRAKPQAGECYFARGDVLAQSGDLWWVMSDLADVLRIDLDLPSDESYYDRTFGLDVAGLNAAPRIDESHFARGQMFARRGQIDQAIADFTRVVEIDERWRENHGNLRLILILAHEQRGELYRKRGEQVLAEKDLATAKRERAIGVGRPF
jgi:tetratricopeptide (TPR) repeat protein